MSPEPQAEPRRVMIVDDDPDVRFLLRVVFEQEGMTVVAEATSEDEAVPEAARCAPDVVVVDGLLAGGTSASLLRRMRALTPGVRLIAYSAMPAAASASAALAAGADVYLQKGELEALCGAVAAVEPGPP